MEECQKEMTVRDNSWRDVGCHVYGDVFQAEQGTFSCVVWSHCLWPRVRNKTRLQAWPKGFRNGIDLFHQGSTRVFEIENFFVRGPVNSYYGTGAGRSCTNHCLRPVLHHLNIHHDFVEQMHNCTIANHCS